MNREKTPIKLRTDEDRRNDLVGMGITNAITELACITKDTEDNLGRNVQGILGQLAIYLDRYAGIKLPRLTSPLQEVDSTGKIVACQITWAPKDNSWSGVKISIGQIVNRKEGKWIVSPLEEYRTEEKFEPSDLQILKCWPAIIERVKEETLKSQQKPK